MAYLEIVGPTRQPVLELTRQPTTIGRAEGSDVRLDGDPAVSRLHALIDPLETGWRISDLGSRNGTYVNEIRVLTPVALRPGDAIRIGSWRLTFSDETADDEPTFLDGDNVGGSTTAAHFELSPREKEVLALLAGGATDQEIATHLTIAAATVRSHLDRIRDKTGCRRRPDLTRLAIEAGIEPKLPRAT